MVETNSFQEDLEMALFLPPIVVGWFAYVFGFMVAGGSVPVFGYDILPAVAVLSGVLVVVSFLVLFSVALDHIDRLSALLDEESAHSE